MKKILLILGLIALFVPPIQAQVAGGAYSSITSHGRGTNSTNWVREFVFTDSGATRIGPILVDQSPIGIAITRDAVWDSAGTGLADLDSVSYHWDSSWTASDFAFLFGFETMLNDSARATFVETDTYDYLPLYSNDNDTARYTVQADSMRYVELPELKMAGAKYMYIEFYDSVGDSLVPQTEPRTLVLFYRKY